MNENGACVLWKKLETSKLRRSWPSVACKDLIIQKKSLALLLVGSSELMFAAI